MIREFDPRKTRRQPSFEEREKNAKIFGEKLMSARAALGLNYSQIEEEFGEEAGYNLSSIQRWEAGDIFPEADKLENIARVYNIDIKELTDLYRLSKAAHKSFTQ
jgi:transcriptional regulator with XRE-family HTH domain